MEQPYSSLTGRNGIQISSNPTKPVAKPNAAASSSRNMGVELPQGSNTLHQVPTMSLRPLLPGTSATGSHTSRLQLSLAGSKGNLLQSFTFTEQTTGNGSMNRHENHAMSLPPGLFLPPLLDGREPVEPAVEQQHDYDIDDDDIMDMDIESVPGSEPMFDLPEGSLLHSEGSSDLAQDYQQSSRTTFSSQGVLYGNNYDRERSPPFAPRTSPVFPSRESSLSPIPSPHAMSSLRGSVTPPPREVSIDMEVEGPLKRRRMEPFILMPRMPYPKRSYTRMNTRSKEKALVHSASGVADALNAGWQREQDQSGLSSDEEPLRVQKRRLKKKRRVNGSSTIARHSRSSSVEVLDGEEALQVQRRNGKQKEWVGGSSKTTTAMEDDLESTPKPTTAREMSSSPDEPLSRVLVLSEKAAGKQRERYDGNNVPLPPPSRRRPLVKCKPPVPNLHGPGAFRVRIGRYIPRGPALLHLLDYKIDPERFDRMAPFPEQEDGQFPLGKYRLPVILPMGKKEDDVVDSTWSVGGRLDVEFEEHIQMNSDGDAPLIPSPRRCWVVTEPRAPPPERQPTPRGDPPEESDEEPSRCEATHGHFGIEAQPQRDSSPLSELMETRPTTPLGLVVSSPVVKTKNPPRTPPTQSFSRNTDVFMSGAAPKPKSVENGETSGSSRPTINPSLLKPQTPPPTPMTAAQITLANLVDYASSEDEGPPPSPPRMPPAFLDRTRNNLDRNKINELLAMDSRPVRDRKPSALALDADFALQDADFEMDADVDVSPPTVKKRKSKKNEDSDSDFAVEEPAVRVGPPSKKRKSKSADADSAYIGGGHEEEDVDEERVYAPPATKRKPKKSVENVPREEESAPVASGSQKPPAPRKTSKAKPKAMSRDERKAAGATSCHQCRNLTMRPKMACASTGCNKIYCNRCIEGGYPDVEFGEDRDDFECPSCEDRCSCTTCCQKRGVPYVSLFGKGSNGAALAVAEPSEPRVTRGVVQKRGVPVRIPTPTTDDFFAAVWSCDGSTMLGRAYGDERSVRVELVTPPASPVRRERTFVGTPLAGWNVEKREKDARGRPVTVGDSSVRDEPYGRMEDVLPPDVEPSTPSVVSPSTATEDGAPTPSSLAGGDPFAMAVEGDDGAFAVRGTSLGEPLGLMLAKRAVPR